MIRAGRGFRFDGESVFVKLGDGLYRAVLNGEAVFIQGIPNETASAHNLAWSLIYPDSGDVIDDYETLYEARCDASLFGMVG
ncbi:MAG: hypothetical protein GY820_39345 [Gammaproteobacteria bacterium]|nr:hypothetical protein [Gammaproteobacteria bacterium]